MMFVRIGEISARVLRIAALPRSAVRITAGIMAHAPAALGRTLTGLVPASSRAIAGAGRLFRAAFLTSKFGLFAVPPAAVGFVAIAAVANPYLRADLDYAHERSSAVQIFDAEGRWLGIVPPASFADWSDGSLLAPDHAAVPVVEIPATWRTCLVFLEDREFDGLSRALGIDPIAVLKSGWQTLSGNRRRGASTLYMQIVRTLHGRSPGRHEAFGEIALRKLAEVFGAKTLARMLAEADPRAAARFAGMHLPLVIGAAGSAFGEPVHGIELAARLLFGSSASALSPEKQAILAAAVKAPIVLARPGDEKGRAIALARWKRAKERADHCLKHAFGDRSAEFASVRDRLAVLALPRPFVDSGMERLLPADPHEAWKITANPARRALYFARHELGLLRRELTRVVGPDWRGRVVAVRLTTSAASSRAFANSVTATLQRLQATVPGLAWSLTPTAEGSDEADVVAACADHEGRIRQVYASRQNLFWDRKSPAGSVAKVVAAIALGRNSQPDTLYCLAPMPGIASSAQGAPCRQNGSWMSAREAFAKSNNQAVHWALRELAGRKTLEDVASALRMPSLGDTPIATALTIGTFELTPAEVLRLQGAVGAGLLGARRDIHGPRIVDKITILDARGEGKTEHVEGDGTIPAADLRRLFTPRVASFVAKALRATSDSDGTLHDLHPIQQELGGALFAKTATVSVLGATRDLHIAGTFVRNGRPWSFVVTVGTPVPSKPLGRRLTAGRIAALAASAICRSAPEGTVAPAVSM